MLGCTAGRGRPDGLVRGARGWGPGRRTGCPRRTSGAAGRVRSPGFAPPPTGALLAGAGCFSGSRLKELGPTLSV